MQQKEEKIIFIQKFPVLIFSIFLCVLSNSDDNYTNDNKNTSITITHLSVRNSIITRLKEL